MNNKIKKPASIFLIVTAILFHISWISFRKPVREYYQLTIYHFSKAEQEQKIDNYLQNALLPALHRINIKNVGVFKAHSNDTTADKTVYVLTPAKSIDLLISIPAKLAADKDYQSAGTEYINSVYTDPPYKRMETIFLIAFPLAPQLQLPALSGIRRERIYELRSYEGATEQISKNKIQMFNEGDEIGLFKRLNFNASFYGEVIAGSKMPNLMYMTCHENKVSRDANWKAFSNDPEWKKLSSRPKYQKNVSRMDIFFLYPTDYSDF